MQRQSRGHASLWKPANNFSLARTSEKDCCSTRSLLNMIMKLHLSSPPTPVHAQIEAGDPACAFLPQPRKEEPVCSSQPQWKCGGEVCFRNSCPRDNGPIVFLPDWTGPLEGIWHYPTPLLPFSVLSFHSRFFFQFLTSFLSFSS